MDEVSGLFTPIFHKSTIIIIRYLYSALQRTQRFTKQYKYTMTKSTNKSIHTKRRKISILEIDGFSTGTWRQTQMAPPWCSPEAGSKDGGPHTWNEMSPACFFLSINMIHQNDTLKQAVTDKQITFILGLSQRQEFGLTLQDFKYSLGND